MNKSLRNRILCTFIPHEGEPYSELLPFRKTGEYLSRIGLCETGYVIRQNGDMLIVDTGMGTVYGESLAFPLDNQPQRRE